MSYQPPPGPPPGWDAQQAAQRAAQQAQQDVQRRITEQQMAARRRQSGQPPGQRSCVRSGCGLITFLLVVLVMLVVVGRLSILHS
jgi:hypothetical protein